jgi:predicted kinase
VPTVHALAGLAGAGKTTVAVKIARVTPAVRFSLDEWMLRLYGLHYEDDVYVQRLEPCRALVLKVAGQVLASGVDVILDGIIGASRGAWRRPRGLLSMTPPSLCTT